MLLLSIDMLLGGAGTPWPAHLGGAIKGFFEGAVKAHASHLLGALRASGENERANFVIQVPPLGTQPNDVLRFGLVLFNALEGVALALVQALQSQCAQRFNGRVCSVDHVSVFRPGQAPWALIEAGRLRSELLHEASFVFAPLHAWAPLHANQPRVHALRFRSPVLLASRGAVRLATSQHRPLPWPTLGQILESVGDALCLLEPTIAQALQLHSAWRAPAGAFASIALTPAHAPAQQLRWLYASTPRANTRHGDVQAPPRHRELEVPGIVGDLIFLASDDPIEHALLHWGQWCGVGQKTTMGFGSYTLNTSHNEAAVSLASQALAERKNL